jgi:integrase/recombinase XerD
MKSNNNKSSVATPDRVESDLSDKHTELFNTFIGRKSMAESSEQTRRSDVLRFLHWCESQDTLVTEISSKDIRSFVDYLVDENLSDQSIVSIYNTTSIFYIYLLSRGHIDTDNPFSDVTLSNFDDVNPGTTKQLKTIVKNDRTTDSSEQLLAISPDQIEKLLDHVPSPAIRNETALRLMAECGMRSVEITRLRLDDIDRDNRHIAIDSAKIQDPDHDLCFRDQWWSDGRLDYIMYRWIEEERPKYSHSDDTDRLFITQQKDKMRPSYISRQVKKAAQEAGINEVLYTDANGNNRWLVTGHTLRISYITHMANNTQVSISTISDLVGHKNISTTQDYIHTSNEHLKQQQTNFNPLAKK